MLYLPSVLRDFSIHAVGPMSQLSLKLGLQSFREVCDHLLHLPYRRPFGKTPQAVLEEGCGTCSSKHGVLKAIADEHEEDKIELILALFRMSMHNTHGIDDLFIRGELDVIPEAHTYIRWGEEKIDVTKPGLHISNLQLEIEKEKVITLQELLRKRELHQEWMKLWLQSHRPDVSLEVAWQQREACIAAIAGC